MDNQPLRSICIASAILGLSCFTGTAAVYKESGGIVVIDAIHFDYRNFEFTDAPVPHHFHIVPDEDGVNTAAHPWGDTHSPDFANSRSGKYLQILPDAGANNGNCTTCPNENVGFPPYAEYKIQITTVGQYQLYLRQIGWDGASDSFFAQILEFAPPGPGPNFYRFAPNPDTPDFNALRNIPFDTTTENQGWSGYAEAAPVVNGGDNSAEKPALYNITTPGLYTIRMSMREDGSAIDALILQLASMPVPGPGNGPAESAISTTAPPYVRAVDPTPGQEQVPPDNNVGCQIVDGSTVTVTSSSIKMIVDGTAVTPVMTKTNNITYLSYKPSPLLASGKAITWSVSFSDSGTPAASYTNSFPFKVLTYSPIPSSYAVPAGSVDKSKPGFLVKPYQTDTAQNDSIAFAEDELSGLQGPNNADLSTANAQGYIEVPDVINFDTANPPVADNFPFTADFPGIVSGGAAVVNNLAEEILTWLDLQPGVYRMVVNGDNGFKVSIGVDPRDKAGLVLGAIDGGAHTFGDLLLVFQIDTAGIYPFRLLYYNANDTTASVEWLTKNEFGRKALINSSTNTTLAVKAYRSGPTYPYVSRLSSSVTGFIVDFTDSAGATVDPNSIKATLNNASISPKIGKTNAVTTINYTSSSLLGSGSTNAVVLTYTDSSGPAAKTRSFTFVAPTYATLTPDYAVGAPDTTKPGFLVRVSQIDAGGTTVEPNNIAFAEQQLAGTVTNTATGQPYPNSAAPNTDGTFVYTEPTVINYDATGTGNNGTFTPDNQMPGFPGIGPTGGTDNAAAEILTYLSLPAGLITMVVASDDGFRVSPATNVVDPHNALTLGIFNAGRGVADTVFNFNVQQAGTFPMRLVWENGNGGANVEWFTINPDGTKVLINDTSNPTALKAYRAAGAGTPPQNAPTITAVTLAGGNIKITWTGGSTLQAAPEAAGPWADIPGAASPATIPATKSREFYRIKQ
jgi:hypothetical protein